MTIKQAYANMEQARRAMNAHQSAYLSAQSDYQSALEQWVKVARRLKWVKAARQRLGK